MYQRDRPRASRVGVVARFLPRLSVMMTTEPFLSALLLLMTSTSMPAAVAAPAPFDANPAIDVSLVDPEKASEKLRGAVASLQRGDTIRATSEALAVLRDDPSHAAAHEVLGSVAMLRNDWRTAERELSEALRLNPRSSTTLTKLGSTLLAMNRVREASEMLRKALAISPGRGSAQRKLAAIEIRQGRPEQAVAELREGIKASKGTDRLTKYFLASLYLEMRHSADAEQLAREIIRGEPSWQPAQILLGIVKLDQGNIDAALPLLAKAAQRVPKSALSRLTAGAKHRATGNLAESLRLLEQVTKDRPDWALAHFELGETLSALKQFDRARQAYARAKRVSATAEPKTKLDGEDLSVLIGVADTYAWQAKRQADPATPTLKAAR
jgi:tetratricopeptide (TPR) repeat protein